MIARFLFAVLIVASLPVAASAHLLPPVACAGPAGAVNPHCFPGHVIPPKPPAPKASVPKAPDPIQTRSPGTMSEIVGPYVMAATFCGATNLWVQAAIKGPIRHQGELTFREAHKAVWNCFLPFVGGWMVDRAFDANPQWPNR